MPLPINEGEFANYLRWLVGSRGRIPLMLDEVAVPVIALGGDIVPGSVIPHDGELCIASQGITGTAGNTGKCMLSPVDNEVLVVEDVEVLHGGTQVAVWKLFRSALGTFTPGGGYLERNVAQDFPCVNLRNEDSAALAGSALAVLRTEAATPRASVTLRGLVVRPGEALVYETDGAVQLVMTTRFRRYLFTDGFAS